MLKLLALVPLLMNTGGNYYRIAQENNMAPGVSAPSPYTTVSTATPAEAKSSAATDDQAAARMRYALSEIARLRNQLDVATGRLDESRRNYAGLNEISDEQAKKIDAAEKRNEELQNELAKQRDKLTAIVVEKKEAELKNVGLEESRNRAWVYCLLVSLAFAVVLMYGLSFSDSFRAILGRLPDKDKDDRITELETELNKRIDHINALELIRERFIRSKASRKRAGKMISGLLRHMDRLATQINSLRLTDIHLRDEWIAARDEEIARLVALQQGSDEAIKRAIAEAQETNDELADLRSTITELRTLLADANRTIEAHNEATAAPDAVPQTIDEIPTMPIVDQAALLAQAALNASNEALIDNSRAAMHEKTGLPPSDLPPPADATPPPGYSR
jgi:hypothetical protein